MNTALILSQSNMLPIVCLILQTPCVAGSVITVATTDTHTQQSLVEALQNTSLSLFHNYAELESALPTLESTKHYLLVNPTQWNEWDSGMLLSELNNVSIIMIDNSYSAYYMADQILELRKDGTVATISGICAF